MHPLLFEKIEVDGWDSRVEETSLGDYKVFYTHPREDKCPNERVDFSDFFMMMGGGDSSCRSMCPLPRGHADKHECSQGQDGPWGNGHPRHWGHTDMFGHLLVGSL